MQTPETFVFWDAKKQRVKKQHPNSELLNAKITKSKAECEQESYLPSLANSFF
ncbi:Arm DNA-binding domain-containing protein [Proteiniphilum sp. X52]|uniref:Arm DNA-binding domain-containing protein n=1 Tax=Proteiniphilum sp. X52 TaxID=2382159 RepID=UPI00351A727F